MVSQMRRSSTRGRMVPTPVLPGRPTLAMKQRTPQIEKRFIRTPASRHPSTNLEGADAPRSTTVRTAVVTGIPSILTMSSSRMSFDS